MRFKMTYGARLSLIILSFFLLMRTSLWGGDSSIFWHTNYKEALVKSQAEKKPLLIYFTASDWSGWCMKLKKEVLDTPAFQHEIFDRFICVEIDFPFYRNLTRAESDRHHSLKEQMEITEYPRLVIVTPDERILTKVGYLPGGGSQMVSHLLNVVATDNKLSEIVKHLDQEEEKELEKYYKRARELGREEDAKKILVHGLTRGEPLFFLFEQYRLLIEEKGVECAQLADLRQKIEQMDPKNERGIQFSLALIDFQELSNQLTIQDNPRSVIKPLEDYIAKYGENDTENRWQVEMMIAQFYLDYEDRSKALLHANMAYRDAPDRMKCEIERSLNYMNKEAS
ncbi:MAG: thioredoxin family protein [Chlamydiia bacterium]|nr:thioredoxin family protein [Chlamydiia bacterium]